MATERATDLLPRPPDPPRVLFATWAKAILGLSLAWVLSRYLPIRALKEGLAGVAAFLFIALPDARLRARGEWWSAYGLPSGSLRERATWALLFRGARTGLVTSALVLPAFGLVFAAYALVLPRLSLGMAHAVAPYDHLGQLALRLPPRFLLEVVLQVLVVALPEELFYRGYLQTSWARGAPSRGRTILGVRLGAGFLCTQLLFAAGHLVGFRPLWRLATFLPALWFGFLREKTDGLAAPIVAHALSNLFIKTLEASFYP